MSARTDTLALMLKLRARDIPASFHDANTLRRAEKTLSRWYEAECGDSDDYASYSIERDEETGVPYWIVRRHRDGPKAISRNRIPDKERGAIRRVVRVCNSIMSNGAPNSPNVYHYVQTDPRGCCLYVGTEPLTDQNYSARGIACCV